MLIFGAAGDLTKRLVVPALYNLANDHQLSEEFRLVGVDLAEMSTEQWRTHLTEAMKGYVAQDGEFHLDEFVQTTWQWLIERTSYLSGDGARGAGRYTDVWARRDGRWLAVSAHVTRLAS